MDIEKVHLPTYWASLGSLAVLGILIIGGIWLIRHQGEGE